MGLIPEHIETSERLLAESSMMNNGMVLNDQLVFTTYNLHDF